MIPSQTLVDSQLMEADQKIATAPTSHPAGWYNKEELYNHQNTKCTSSNYEALTILTTFIKARICQYPTAWMNVSVSCVTTSLTTACRFSVLLIIKLFHVTWRTVQ